MTINEIDCHKLVAKHIEAWNVYSPEKVSETYAKDARFIINQGEPMNGRSDIAEMAAGFMAEFPDMVLSCENIFIAGKHMVYTWTLNGHHIDTKNAVNVTGWEEWDLNDDMLVQSSLGWYDASDYERQVAEGV